MTRKNSPMPYCVACRLRWVACVCPDAPRLSLSTRILVVMHASEWGRSSNTGHLARLALTNSDVRVHGRRGRAMSEAGIDADSSSTLVLFPGRGGRSLTADLLADLPRPFTLIVPDGNWNQTKNMMRRLPMLQSARSVLLDAPRNEFDFSRRNVYAERRSTFEAIAQALGVLEGPATEARLLDFYRQVLDRRGGANAPV